MTTASRGNVLISGASIAGPVAAFWLNRLGYTVTIVEKAPNVRGGGYPIDIRGTALTVIDRMGLLPQLQQAHVDTRRITFLNPDGSNLATLTAQDVAIGVGDDLEVRRGDLTRIITNAISDSVEWIFNDSIATLDDHSHQVNVTFHSGSTRSFDLVIGADGIHSHTRRLLFGPEERFHRYLGSCYAGFSMPNRLGLAHEGIIWNVPGRAAALYAVGAGEDVFGLLTFRREDPLFEIARDPSKQRELVTSMFPETSWILPDMIETARSADDFFFDLISQIRTNEWFKGRVALTGDAVHAPSFLTGQGTSLALTSAYVLANEIATNADHTAAFASYQQQMLPFATENQDLVDAGDPPFFPATEQALSNRNIAFAEIGALPPEKPNPTYSALALRDYR